LLCGHGRGTLGYNPVRAIPGVDPVKGGVMALSTVAELVQELAHGPLLSPERRQELARLQAAFPDARALARELVRLGWLTPYQVNQLVLGRGRDLVLGPYVLLERLGEGAMGQVFKAQHTFLNRAVALKLITRAHLGTGAAAERFLLEMRLVAHLDHPHIVRALDAGQAGERYYLAMELIEGATLARLVQQRGPLPIGQACACILQAALGLQHACERGLVHRDIKPSNLMLATPPGGPPAVKVLDLGLARPQGGESSRDLTRTGTLMGTLDYLAPEQALDPRGVDIRADIYSLGCTFFFLLTGRPPFQGGTDAQKLLQHQQQEPPAVEALSPDVPPAVAATLRRMLAKRPEQRFQTPAELAAALRPFASWDGGPAAAGAPAAAAVANSLIDMHGGTNGERGWTLMVDPTRVPGGGSTAPGLSPSVAGSLSTSKSSFGLPLPPSVVAAPSTAPAAPPEEHLTLLAEPPVAVRAPAVMAAEVVEPEPPPWRPLPVGLIVGIWTGLSLLALVSAGLAWLLRSSPPPDVPIAHRPENAADKKPPAPEGKQPEQKQPLKKQPEAAPPVPPPPPFKGFREVHIKPDQPMSLARTGDILFPTYATGLFAMADSNDRSTFHVWDLTSMKAVGSFSGVSGLQHPRALSPDGRWLAGKAGGELRICDAEKGATHALALPEGRADWVEFAGPGRLVTLRQNDPGRGLEVWDLKTQKVLFSLPLPNGYAGERAAASPDGKLLAIPGGNLLALQELRPGARPTVLAMPKQRGSFAPNCRKLVFTADGTELAGLFEEPFIGLRVVSWDLKRGAVSKDHPIAKGTVQHEFFYPREASPLEWLPGRSGWLVYGQALIDYQNGNVRGRMQPPNTHRQNAIWVLTGTYAVEVSDREVRIITLPQAK
jgi:serine/threonine-protein kinase